MDELKPNKSPHAEREERILASWKEKGIFEKSLEKNKGKGQIPKLDAAAVAKKAVTLATSKKPGDGEEARRKSWRQAKEYEKVHLSAKAQGVTGPDVLEGLADEADRVSQAIPLDLNPLMHQIQVWGRSTTAHFLLDRLGTLVLNVGDQSGEDTGVRVSQAKVKAAEYIAQLWDHVRGVVTAKHEVKAASVNALEVVLGHLPKLIASELGNLKRPDIETMQQAILDQLIEDQDAYANSARRVALRTADLKGSQAYAGQVVINAHGIVTNYSAGRTPSPFSNMGAHTTAWVVHEDEVKTAIRGKRPQNALLALIDVGNSLLRDPGEQGGPPTAVWIDTTGPLIRARLTSERNTLRALLSFAQEQADQHQAGLSTLQDVARQIAVVQNLMPAATVDITSERGGKAERSLTAIHNDTDMSDRAKDGKLEKQVWVNFDYDQVVLVSQRTPSKSDVSDAVVGAVEKGFIAQVDADRLTLPQKEALFWDMHGSGVSGDLTERLAVMLSQHRYSINKAYPWLSENSASAVPKRRRPTETDSKGPSIKQRKVSKKVKQATGKKGQMDSGNGDMEPEQKRLKSIPDNTHDQAPVLKNYPAAYATINTWQGILQKLESKGENVEIPDYDAMALIERMHALYPFPDGQPDSQEVSDSAQDLDRDRNHAEAREYGLKAKDMSALDKMGGRKSNRAKKPKTDAIYDFDV